ncbi:MAG TPA: DNA polymerase/3'-5' exonuclease PolX, partial [Candidatus Binatia bacterium]
MKDRFEIAADLREIARLLAIKSENPFKTQAYQRGASALETLAGDFDALVEAGRVNEIAGIGSALAATIDEIYRTGECWRLQQMRQELPPGIVELSEIPGLSLNKIIALHETLRIENIAGLKAACREGLIRKVKGFGAKSQAKLLADIEKLESPKDGSLLLYHALA